MHCITLVVINTVVRLKIRYRRYYGLLAVYLAHLPRKELLLSVGGFAPGIFKQASPPLSVPFVTL